MEISKNFTLEELYMSPTALRLKINNIPSKEAEDCLVKLVLNILQPIRDEFGQVHINSAYRCELLNKKVKGSKTSQHVLGQAADINMPDNREVFKYILKNLPFDQLIWEYGNDQQPSWIHVSFGPRNRKEVLITKPSGGYKKFNLKLK